MFENIWIRACSHKPIKINDLDEADSESLLVASDEKIGKSS